MSRLVVSIRHVEVDDGQTVYLVSVQQDEEAWEVRHTYSAFRKLREDILHTAKDSQSHVVDDKASQRFFSSVQQLTFPSKRLFGSKSDRVVKTRAAELHRFINKVLCYTHSYLKDQELLRHSRKEGSHKQDDRAPASASVFSLMRNFLTPETYAFNGFRVLRESKMAALRTADKSFKSQSSGEDASAQPEAENQEPVPRHDEKEASSLSPGVESPTSPELEVSIPSSPKKQREVKPPKSSGRKKKSNNDKTSSRVKSSGGKTSSTSSRKAKMAAQNITLQVQKEMEEYLTEYNAIMVLRYVDRFINKASTKTPGCYRVDLNGKLVVDAERFVEELEETFTDIPSTLREYFQTSLQGDYGIPKSLDEYIQMKWQSFQNIAPGSNSRSRNESEDLSSDSDSDVEYVVESHQRYVTKQNNFTQDEEDVLEEMVANGTAGKDQVLRLRRQMNERGWNRGRHPSRRVHESNSDSSDSDSSSSDESV